MKLAFSGQARYPDMTEGYELYVRRARTSQPVDIQTYNKIVKDYCKMLAEELEEYGMVDLPSDMGSLATIRLQRKPQYRRKKFVGYGKWDWKCGHHDGSFTAFGITFLPKREKSQNLRCYGFVTNRRLFQRIKEKYDAGCHVWAPLTFNDEMI